MTNSSSPCAIYHTPEKLVNLALSSVGQALLFGKEMKLTNAASFSSNQAESRLMILDVVSGRLKMLVEEALPKNNHMMTKAT
jgi:hypothetical protein|tara:strand:+ start:1246 stop:1491 length:246 start_codon:yes stop_codon:yes gene_type:complete